MKADAMRTKLGGWATRLLRRVKNLACEDGSTLAEFAVTLPIFVTIITGTTSFAVGMYSLQQLSNATQNAVQVVAAGNGIASDPCAVAKTQVAAYLPNWTASNFTYTMAITDNNGTVHSYTSTGTSFSCTAGATLMSQNAPVVLTVKFDYTWLPILAFSPSSALRSTQGAVAD